jgi:hypothetical protein
MIHQGYEKAAVEGIKPRTPDHPLSVHAEHCFDYLRQAILCAADTTLEHVNPELYGFETSLPKKCRNVDQVAEWAAKWKTDRLPRDLDNRFAFIRQLERVVYQGDDHIET